MRVISNSEFLLLLSFFFVLPLYEGPKNLFLALYILVWCIQSWKAKDFGGMFRLWEWCLVLFLIAGFISAYSNPFGWSLPLSGTLTGAKLIIPALLLSRTSIPNNKVTLLGLSIILSTMIGVLASWYVWLHDNNPYPELNSVGHVNQSALYIAIGFGVAVSLFICKTSWVKVLAAASALFFAIAMIPTISITAVAVIIVMAIVAICIQFKSDRNSLIRLVISLFVGGCVLFVSSLYIPKVKEFQSEIAYHMNGADTGGSFFSKRDLIFNAVILVLPDFLFFGAGDRHFDLATSPEYVESKAIQKGITFEPEHYEFTNHGHNIVTSFLLNRGLVGLFLILSFLFFTARMHIHWLIQYYVGRCLELEPVIGIMTGIYVIIGGMGNSTLYVEHGQLAFCLIGISMGVLQMQKKSNRKFILSKPNQADEPITKATAPVRIQVL